MLILQFAILGIGTGAIYALLGSGLVLIYRGAGILNLAYGAYAMVGAFCFYQLHVAWQWSFAPAFIASVLFVAGLGGLTHLLIMRPLRHASGLVRLIATLGILSVFVGAVLIIKGPGTFIIPPSLPHGIYHIGSLWISEDVIFLFAIAVVVVVGLQFVSRHTTFGLATSAVAENERAASALGWSPDLVAATTWSVGCGLAAVAGILIVPSLGLSATSLTYILIAAMAAALLGDFSSFYLTLFAGLAIGILQSETSRYSVTGLADSVPFFAILIILAVRGSRLPIRGHVLDKLPKLGNGILKPRAIAATVLIVTLLMMFVFPVGLTLAVGEQAAVGMILLSIVVLTGYGGQLSLGQYAIAGLGALFAGRAAENLHWPFELTLIVGVAGAALVGAVFALPALRTRGVSLAVVTLGLGLAVQEIIFFNPSITGGVDGTPVGTPYLFGLNISFIEHPVRYAVVCVVVFMLASIAVANVRRGRAGRRLVAIRTNERAASALGISVFESKIFAFMLASGIAGLGGIFIGFRGPNVIFTAFDPISSINAVGYSVIGGIGYASGPIVGSGLAPGTVGSYILGRFGSLGYWLVLIGGLATLQILLQNPNGLIESGGPADPFSQSLIRKVRERRSRTRGDAQSALKERFEAESAAMGSVAHRAKEAILELREVSVAFRGVTALNGLNLTVRAGEVVGLIGPNGAGKTTAIDAITGYVGLSSGSILYNGAPIDSWQVHKRVRAGISRSFQSLELFDDLSVYENLQAASDSRDRWAYLSNLVVSRGSGLTPAAVAAIRELDLLDSLNELPSNLPYGRRRLVAIARALATGPSILLLDEPAAGLDTHESAELSSLIRSLASEWGIGVLLVEHDMSVIMNSCERVAVVEFGNKIAEDSAARVQVNPDVIAAYLGSSHDEVVLKDPVAAIPEESVP
jgi:ABC-type branched-subunit amino acid transport system ATPase component/branched-subunit amino acid ABC-type transport system permease component